MDLARDEETRVRNLGRLALEKAAKAGASKAGSNGISRTFATVSRVNGDGTIDVSMGDYTDVNGVTSECILRGLRMTVACSGAQVGDRVIVDTYAHVSVVTGILANADNTHSVKYFYGNDNTNGVPGYCKYEKIGRMVTVSFGWSKTGILATLPEGVRPVIRVTGVCVIMGTNVFGQIAISPKGVIEIVSSTNNSYWGGSLTFCVA